MFKEWLHHLEAVICIPGIILMNWLLEINKKLLYGISFVILLLILLSYRLITRR